jgi:hypothetical protein
MLSWSPSHCLSTPTRAACRLGGRGPRVHVGGGQVVALVKQAALRCWRRSGQCLGRNSHCPGVHYRCAPAPCGSWGPYCRQVPVTNKQKLARVI